MKLKAWALSLALSVFGAGAILATPDDDLAKLEARLEQIKEDLRVAKAKRSTDYRAAESEAEKDAILRTQPWKGLDAQARRLAEDAKGTEVGAKAWGMIFLNADREQQQNERWEAYRILIEDYADSPALLDVVNYVQYTYEGKAEAISGLRQLIKTSSVERIKAASLMSLGSLLEQEDASKQEAYRTYRLILEKYGTLKNPRGVTYGSLAKAALFEAEKLQVGMPVPDMSSTDEANAAFSVSDYRGKVLLLDFWGFW